MPMKLNSVVCDKCSVCTSIHSDELAKWLVVTKTVSEIGEPWAKPVFQSKEYYCPKCRKDHE